MPAVERKLAAIFAADIAGYSRLMGQDEVGTLARLKACREIIDRLIAAHRGRIFNTAGDSVVADFRQRGRSRAMRGRSPGGHRKRKCGWRRGRNNAIPHRHPCRGRDRRGDKPIRRRGQHRRLLGGGCRARRNLRLGHCPRPDPDKAAEPISERRRTLGPPSEGRR